MGDVGLLLSLPTGSIAVRVALASVVAVVAARLLLRAGLRSPRVRAMVALLPALAIVATAITYAGSPALPSVWHTVEAAGGLSVPVRDTYLSFVPAALPLLLGGYAAVVAVRLGLRLHRGRAARRSLRSLAAAGRDASPRIRGEVARLADELGTPVPEVVVTPGLRGGAAVIGLRRPVLLLGQDLLVQLDRHELEGVLAHELAHVARRDNLVAAGLGVLRDLFFFVPAGTWSLRRLLREREHAADLSAVEVTGRPGALAGGLLKVLEAAHGPTADACAPLLAEGTLVSRVEELCDDRPAPSRTRRHGEIAVTVLALSGAMAVAAVVPGTVAGADHQRDALGVLFSDVNGTGEESGSQRSAVFEAFDEAGGTASATAAVEPTDPADPAEPASTLALDDPEKFTAQGLAGCEVRSASCQRTLDGRRLRLAPEPVVRVDSDLVDRWRLDPVVRSDDGRLGLFWLQRQQAR